MCDIEELKNLVLLVAAHLFIYICMEHVLFVI